MRTLLAAFAVLLLFGCSSFGRSGCVKEACDRPTSTHREVIIWWPPSMRDGLGQGSAHADFTRVPLED